jgi:hypothetical protein
MKTTRIIINPSIGVLEPRGGEERTRHFPGFI